MYTRQCSLERVVDGVKTCQISWIPEKFAKAGKYLKLKENNVWEHGWKVVHVGARRTAAETNIRSQDYKTQRVGSDI